MILSGFADEAASDLAGQIRATKKLGWKHIEARSVDGQNLNDLPEEKFLEVVRVLGKEGIHINCLGSTIANWGADLDAPFNETLAHVDRAVRRMKMLEIPMIRIMSYKVYADADGRALDQRDTERFDKLRQICSRFLDAGLTPVHENCHTYGGMSLDHCQRLLDELPGLKLVFDTGNPPLTNDFSEPFPYPKQSSWAFYERFRKYIVHVHIKDAYYEKSTGAEIYTFPGEGQGDVVRIVNALKASGYDGAFSIEPHMAVVFHDQSVQSDAESRFRNYEEYGQRFIKILDEAGYKVKDWSN
ncbi:MAG: sugar phosphate isomerase/epimerase family protein [Clostridia bacterium]